MALGKTRWLALPSFFTSPAFSSERTHENCNMQSLQFIIQKIDQKLILIFKAVSTPLGFLFYTIFRESPFGIHPRVTITTWFSITGLVIMVPAIFLYNSG